MTTQAAEIATLKWEDAFPDVFAEKSFAALATAEAIAAVALDGGDVTEKIKIVQSKLAREGGKHIDVDRAFSTLVSTLRLFATNEISCKWPQEVVDLLRKTHSVKVQQLPRNSAGKQHIRSDSAFACHLCGTHEKNCEYVLHVAADRDGRGYDTADWLTADTSKILASWSTFAKGYSTSLDVTTHANSESAPDWYAGIMVPGETCLRHLQLAVKSQNLILDVVRSAHSKIAASTDFSYDVSPMSTFGADDVAKVAEVIRMIDAAQASPSAFVPQTEPADSAFWSATLRRFAKSSGLRGHQMYATGGTPTFLKAAYDQMSNTLRGDVCQEVVEDGSDDEEDGSDRDDRDDRDFVVDDDAPIEYEDGADVFGEEEAEGAEFTVGRRRRRRRSDAGLSADPSRKRPRRTTIVCSDDEDDEDDGEDGGDEMEAFSGVEPQQQQQQQSPASVLPPPVEACTTVRTEATAEHQCRVSAASAAATTQRRLERARSRSQTLDNLVRVGMGMECMEAKATALHIAAIFAKCLALFTKPTGSVASVPDVKPEFAAEVRSAVRDATHLAWKLACEEDAMQEAAVFSAAAAELVEFW